MVRAARGSRTPDLRWWRRLMSLRPPGVLPRPIDSGQILSRSAQHVDLTSWSLGRAGYWGPDHKMLGAERTKPQDCSGSARLPPRTERVWWRVLRPHPPTSTPRAALFHDVP